MKLTGRPFAVLLSIWTLIVPTGIVYLIWNHPISDVNWWWLALSVTFGFLSIYFPIIHNGKSIILFVWFTLPIFLLYGLTAEVLVTQVIVIAAVLTKAHTGIALYRLFYNSLAYFVLSMVSAAAFTLTGAEVGSLAFGSLAAGVFAYQITYSLLYDGIFTLYGRLTARMRKNTVKETLFHYLRLIVVVPLSLSLYYVLAFYGIIGYFLVGIPYFFITFVMRLSTRQEDVNAYIQSAGNIGQQLARMTKENDITETFMADTTSLFEADYVYLYEYYDGWLEPRQFYVNGEKSVPPDIRLGNGQGIAGQALVDGAGVLFTRRDQWADRSLTAVPANFESLMCVPLFRQHESTGAIVLGSQKRDAFKDFHLKVLDLLSSYYVVAVEKAMYIESAEKESNRCALTGLFNYGYLEKQLEKEVALLNIGVYSQVAVVMLDIDYFKQVNDTYGHESGNQVLRQLAGILQQRCPAGGTVARYGGEEFVYVLPNVTKSEAMEFAEALRLEIAAAGMRIGGDLTQESSDQTIRITSSFGVSGAPEDTDEAMTLLRNADRALYIGAKQAGRNRVGGYVK